MFRFFGGTILGIKTIQRLNDKCIDQDLWMKLLVNIDLKISKYHDYNDIILISSPYLIDNISESLSNALSEFNLKYVSKFIIEYLFGNEKNIEYRLQFIENIDISIGKIKQLLKTMSIIIIDIKSSEMIKIPSFVSDLLVSNSANNNHTSGKDKDSISNIFWKIRWSTNSYENKISVNFQNIMNDICKQWKNNKDIMKYFYIYISDPPNILNKLSGSKLVIKRDLKQLEERQVHFDKKIQICLNNAKQKSKNKNKKGVLFELKRKKAYEKALVSIQDKKINLETQLINWQDDDDKSDSDDSLDEDTKLIQEVDELINECCESMNVPSPPEMPLEVPISTDDELAELEAMMN